MGLLVIDIGRPLRERGEGRGKRGEGRGERGEERELLFWYEQSDFPDFLTTPPDICLNYFQPFSDKHVSLIAACSLRMAPNKIGSLSGSP